MGHFGPPSVPAAETRGVAELKEAFRALQALKPINEDFAFVTDHGVAGCACVDLRQHYTLLGRPFKLYSRVLVRHDAAGRIESITECWRGIPLSDAVPFALARRLNGIISYNVTPLVLSARHGA